MKPRLLLLSLCCCVWGCATQGQVSTDNGTPVRKGYDITIKGEKEIPSKLYLYGHNGIDIYCLDSSIVIKNTNSFKNKKKEIPCGVYTVSPIPNASDLDALSLRSFPVIINQGNHFSINLTDNASSDNEENNILLRYHTQMSQKRELVRTMLDNLAETAPDAFVTQYIRIDNFSLYGEALNNNTAYQHLLDLIDFSDPRLLHVPGHYIRAMLEYILEPEDQNAADCIAKVDQLLSRCTNPIVRDYYIRSLFSLLDVHNPDYDPVLVHLYDHYDHSWIEEGSERRIERKINNLRKIIPGARIPELISHDIEGKAHSTLDIKAHYTVLWFWDPDCDHCQEMTPPLHQLYQEHGNDYDFEVFAVEVNDDYERWKAFSYKHQLWDWTNLSTSRGEQNIDFIEYFDIMTTPVMFLIDNTQDHTIIARQITLDELRLFFKNRTTKE